MVFRSNTQVAMASVIASTLLLSSCSSKKAEFRKEMTSWVTSHSTAAQFCTSFKGISPQQSTLSATYYFGVGNPARFYEPSPAFSKNTKIFAIESGNAKPPQIVTAMLRERLLEAISVKNVTDTITLRAIPHSFDKTMVHHYKISPETFYILTKNAVGFHIQGSHLISVSPIHKHDTTPLVLKNKQINYGFVAPQWCGGTARITKVNQYTIPASQGGVIMSTVEATAIPFGMPPWLSDRVIQKSLKTAVPKAYKAEGTFVKTSNGWKLTGGVQIDTSGQDGF
ncbi:MAG: hypothetical protein PHI71_01470 [Acidiphilium sp.]|nr:hypothetical protein [Acidiphilium sp.]